MKQISETIDGSIKDIIQLKTLDNSLEYSQMFDALEDTPREFQVKLVDALNSLGETMQVPPTEAFNKVLCKSDDENEDVTKKLYNWWRAFFEVLGKCEKIPNDRKTEFNQKIDDLMAEIMKAGDAEATDEEELVMESTKPRFKRGDFVVVRNGDDARVLGYHRDRVDKSIWYEVWIMDGNRTTEFQDEDVYASREEYEAKYLYEENYEQATKEDEDKMLADMDFAIQHIGEVANKVKDVVNFINPYCGTSVNEGHMVKPGRYGIGDHVLYKGEECVVTDVDEDLRNDEEIYQVSRDSDKVDGLSFNYWATWDEIEPVEGFTEEVKNTMKFNKIEENRGGNSEWVSMNDIIGKGFEESGEEKPMNEAQVVVDANTVWKVLELLEDDVANKNLTDLINSHLRTKDEIMDAIDSYVEVNWHGKVKKQDLDKLFTDWMYVIVDDLGLDVDKYRENGEFVDKDKPTSVELESMEAGETKKVTLYVDWDDDGAGLDNNVVIDVPAEIADSEESDALYDYIMDWIDHQDFCVNDWAITDIEGLMDEGSEEVKKPEEVRSQDKTFNQDGENKTLVAGEGDNKKEMSDAEAATIMGGASDTDMDAADMGLISHKVADPYNKKPVCEMTIEQEVDNPWNLAEMLWSQGKENLEELLRSELVGEEDIMMMLEDMGLRNLTNINDAFAFDFPSILDSLGLDGEAWSQNLEFKRKDDDSED